MRADCIDAEILAAWVEGGLPPDETARVETHLSTCARCQDLLAAYSRTAVDESVDAPTVVPFWSRRSIRLAGAGLAAAAALVLWTWPRPTTPATQVPESTVAAIPPAPAPDAPAPRTTPAPSIPPAPRTPAPRTPAPGRTSAPGVMPAPPPPAAPPVAVATPPPPSPVQEVRVTAPPPVVTDAFRAVVTERSSIEIVSAVPRNAPAQAARFDVAARSGAGRGGGALGGVLARPPVRWRVSANTIVERSSDDGQTWTTVVIDPPAFLTAGSAPFQDVCWLVGRDGVVLRSTDGLMFGRVTVPAPVALIAVTATDALGAIVTAVDGRVFVTTDGGVTWVVR